MKIRKEVKTMVTFSLQLKPVGSKCNIKCRYCYAEPFKKESFQIMNYEVLEKAISECIINNDKPTITYHGGEPMLPGIKFYQKAQDIIAKYQKPGQVVRQVMQTNGTLVTLDFAHFFKKYNFEIGISIDGPKDIHDLNRVDFRNKGSFNQTMKGLKILRYANLNPSVIATVTNETLPYAEETFDFLIKNGFRSIKYSPVYDVDHEKFSISNQQWFEYLLIVFKQWLKNNDSEISIVQLDELIAWLDPDENFFMCSSNHGCLHWVSIDPDGSIYPCSYFKADIPYGNILNTSLSEVAKTLNYKNFYNLFTTSPVKCQKCQFGKFCGNGCPAIRVRDSIIDPTGIYVYCEERLNLFQIIKETFESET